MPENVATSTRAIALAALSMLALAACDRTGPRAVKPVSVSFLAGPNAVPARAATSPLGGASFSVAAAAPDVVVDSVHLVLSEVELEVASGSCVTTNGAPAGECEGIELPPTLVKIRVGDPLRTSWTAPIPVGQYAALEATLDVVSRSSDPSAAAFIAANPTYKDISIRAYGKYLGNPFVYTSALKVDFEIPFATPLAVVGDNTNITVALDPAGWFLNGTTYIDPASTSTNAANAAIVEANIRKSFKAFEDDNRDGVPDSR